MKPGDIVYVRKKDGIIYGVILGRQDRYIRVLFREKEEATFLVDHVNCSVAKCLNCGRPAYEHLYWNCLFSPSKFKMKKRMLRAP